MWISQVTIKNYRPFDRDVTIDLSKESQEKFTVIEAKADTGKTSFLSAISWCLYGKEQQLHEDSLNIMNINRKDEMVEGDVDTVAVKISLNEKDDELPTYIIERSMMVIKKGGELIFPEGGTHVNVQEWEGHNSRPLPEADGINVINSLLLEDIQGFFLFEGEKLEKNFSFYNPDNIKSATMKVSQVKQISNAIDHLQTVRDSVYVDSKGEGDQEMLINQARITQFQDEIKRIDDNVRELDADLSTALIRKDEINKVLDEKNVPLIQELNARRKELEVKNKELDNKLIELKKDTTDKLLSDAPLAISLKSIKELLKKIEVVDKNNELPPKIKNIYLNELLDKGMCVCGRSLDGKDKDTKEAIQCIIKMLKQNDLSDIAETMIQGKYVLKNMIKGVSARITDERERMISECTSLENNIKTNKAEIDNIDLKLGDSKENDILGLGDERKTLESSIIQQTGSIARLKASIKMKEATISELRNRNDQLGKKKKGYEEKRQIAEFLDRSLQILRSIEIEILDEIRHRVEKKTFESFQSLHWDKESYAEFSITSSYNLSLKDRNGNERIYNLSSGTKHVLLLSFISALIEVSGYRFPIFIDTPLANTDIEQRENIARILPEYLKGNQVVLLMKDQEYNPPIRKLLSARVGKEMRMIKVKGKTEVRKWK